ncbi:hypothetical protein [Devosia nitrariae]|uniref:hypothetical protein n=1 Tax=Devosia nitrariae TaxID=2071872 RepID=UPI0024E16F18|nr:hypothetical protein [Devosia nitrariae]
MADIAEYTAGKRPQAVAPMHRFRDLVLALGDVEERVHRSEVAWARKRVLRRLSSSPAGWRLPSTFCAPSRIPTCDRRSLQPAA